MKVEYTSSTGLKVTFEAPKDWTSEDVTNYVVRKSGSNVKLF